MKHRTGISHAEPDPLSQTEDCSAKFLYSDESTQHDLVLEASWNVMAHMQKSDFVFRRNGRAHLNRLGRQFSRLPAAEVCRSAFIVGSNATHTMFWGSEKGTGYPLHSPVSPSLPLPCVTVCHHISTGVYYFWSMNVRFITPVKWQIQYSIRHHNNKCCNMPLTSLTCKIDFEYLKGTTQW